MDENSICDGLTIESVRKIIKARTGKEERAGWYFKQFLNMAWACRCQDRCYVALDADTFILNKVEFIDANGNYLFTPKIEYHKPYFDTINKLFQGEVTRVGDFSFIAENMIFDCTIMKELISDIERNNHLQGTHFWEKILYSVEKEELLKSGFAEYETYGNYISTKYPERVHLRNLRTQREALVLLGGNPSEKQLEWAAKDYDIISIESCNYPKTFMTKLTNISFIQKNVSLKKLAKARYRVRSVYRKILGKPDFRFENY